MKKIFFALVSLLLVTPIAMGLWAPSALADACSDADGDGYITLGSDVAAATLGETFKTNGNYDSNQWQSFFDAYKNAVATTPDPACDNITFKKGAEPVRCDSPLIATGTTVYDASKVPSVSGGQVHPGAYDIPGNAIDEDCDGADGKFLASDAPGVGKDLGGLIQRSMSLLSKVVMGISVLIMIWGGILYATAAGDEQKTAKARKAIIGAVIGLVIGLLAQTIVNYVASNII